ncbi:MAG: winged helix-turn-helix domain-containing protein [Candidatus Rokuibacteriota bacterium]
MPTAPPTGRAAPFSASPGRQRPGLVVEGPASADLCAPSPAAPALGAAPAEITLGLTGARSRRRSCSPGRNGLNWSWQKPERRARQRDEAAIAHWKTTTWPHIRKAARRGAHLVFRGRCRVADAIPSSKHPAEPAETLRETVEQG